MPARDPRAAAYREPQPLTVAGPSADGPAGTLAGVAPFGARLTDTTTGRVSVTVSHTLAAPAWQLVGTQAV